MVSNLSASIEREKIVRMKEILKKIHEGVSIDKLREEFRDLLKLVEPWEIPLIEQELVKEGTPIEEITKLCDLHVELFREFVAGRLNIDVFPEGHPLRTLFEENMAFMRDLETLNLYFAAFINAKESAQKQTWLEKIREFLREMKSFKKHFAKSQMLLFPYLERLGITAVPKVLWTKQDEVLFKLKSLIKLFSQELPEIEKSIAQIREALNDFVRTANDMIFRENNIFFPTMAVILSDAEWYAVKLQEDRIGHYKLTPAEYRPDVEPIYPFQFKKELSPEQLEKLPPEFKKMALALAVKPDYYEVKREGDIELDLGFLSIRELNAIFKALPIEITFVGADGRTRYIVNKDEQIFVRTPSVIGRKVEFCHPPRSIDIVLRIVKSFKEGRDKPAVFWAKVGDKTIYVSYIPVRDENGELLGILEVVQDLTEIKKIIESGKIPYFDVSKFIERKMSKKDETE